MILYTLSADRLEACFCGWFNGTGLSGVVKLMEGEWTPAPRYCLAAKCSCIVLIVGIDLEVPSSFSKSSVAFLLQPLGGALLGFSFFSGLCVSGFCRAVSRRMFLTEPSGKGSAFGPNAVVVDFGLVSVKLGVLSIIFGGWCDRDRSVPCEIRCWCHRSSISLLERVKI